jgi:hypothetical protein
MKKWPSILFLTLCSLIANAQNLYEALRYSQVHAGGTARGLGSGSAFGALGADFTAVGINPGGLGMYRKSEIFISMNLNNTVSESNFGGNSRQHHLNFHLPNYGLVFSRYYVDKRGNRSRGNWIAVNFAFGMNRRLNFNTERFYENNINAQSILPSLAGELNGIHPNQINYGVASFESVLAYAAYLVNPLVNDSFQYNTVTDGALIGKQVSVATKGRMDELSFALAANYNYKWYFGCALGVPLINYSENIIYREYDLNNQTPEFDHFQLINVLNTRGAGVNMKVGAQYHVHDWIRAGLAFHTPSYIRLRDNYMSFINSVINDSTGYQEQSPDGSFRYRLLTPWRGVASVAVILKQYGFLSVDYEYADFRRSRYAFTNEFQAYESLLNRSVHNGLNHSHTIRVGAEAVIKNFRLRGGYNISTNPMSVSLQNTVPEDNRLFQSYSAGTGYRGEQFSIDIAYIRTVTDNSAIITNNIVSADRIMRNNFVLTLGLRF